MFSEFCIHVVMLQCWRTREFHNSPDWSITKVYLLGDKLTERVAIHSPLHELGTETKSSGQEDCSPFLSAFIVHETTLKVDFFFFFKTQSQISGGES